MKFTLQSEYAPGGDQPVAIQKLVKGLNNGDQAQTLLGVTGSGKTFTMANVIQEVQRPTLILSHNKTLAAQLYGEMKSFFPNNAVEYFISYYDYYQPEAYIAASNLYIEKDLSINSEIEKLRLRATSSLVSGRRDVIIVASVSCIYGIGNPDEFSKSVVKVAQGQNLNRSQFLFSLVDILYNRTTADFTRGTFRVKGDTVDIFPAYADFAFRILFWGDDVEEIQTIDPETGKPKLDKNQSDETAKKRPVLGLINIWGFVPKENNVWDEGNIYDPKNGNTYSSTMKLINANTLEVRGYIGVSLIGRTDTWTRQVK